MELVYVAAMASVVTLVVDGMVRRWRKSAADKRDAAMSETIFGPSIPDPIPNCAQS